MVPRKQRFRALMVLHTSGLTGPNKATLSLARAMDPAVCAIDFACPASGPLVGRLARAEIRHIPLEFNGCPDILVALRLAGILKKGGYAICHGHLGRVGPITYTAAKLAGSAAVLTEHMADSDHSWLGNDRLRRSLHNCGHALSNTLLDRVIAVSENAARAYVSRQAIRPEKVTVIPNGVYFGPDERAADRRQARKELGITGATPLIGTVARLVKVKGVADFIVAAGRISSRYPAARFLVAGDGPERVELERLAAEAGIRDKILFLGFREDIERVYAALDICVQPSRAEMREAFGLVVIEAMAQRVPVIVSSALSAGQVADGVNGLVFEQADPGALAGCVKKLLDDVSLSARLAEAGYREAATRFNAAQTAVRTVQVYEEVLLARGRVLPASGNNACPVCNGRESGRASVPWKKVRLAVTRCDGCGLISIGREEAAASADPLKFCLKTGDVFGGIFNALMDALSSRRTGKIAGGSPGRILDAGCGDGRFLRSLRDRGWECWGTDRFGAESFAPGNKGITYRNSPGLDFECPAKYFDCVTFWHSFEHMDDPAAILSRVSFLLKDGGRLFISVPDGASVGAGISLRHWLGFLPEHRFVYTGANLAALLERHGFEVVSRGAGSLEYAVPFFVQSLLNLLGGETNFLHDVFKRNRLSGGFGPRRLYTILLTAFLLPLLVTAGAVFFLVTSAAGRGEVLEMDCRKRLI